MQMSTDEWDKKHAVLFAAHSNYAQLKGIMKQEVTQHERANSKNEKHRSTTSTVAVLPAMVKGGNDCLSSANQRWSSPGASTLALGSVGKQGPSQRQDHSRGPRHLSGSRSSLHESKKSASSVLRILGINTNKALATGAAGSHSKPASTVTAANIDEQLNSLKQAQIKRRANQQQIINNVGKQLSQANIEVLMGYHQDDHDEVSLERRKSTAEKMIIGQYPKEENEADLPTQDGLGRSVLGSAITTNRPTV